MFDFALPSSGAITETIIQGLNQAGSFEVSSGNQVTVLGGASANAPLSPVAGESDVWTAAGIQYTFSPVAGSALGTLTISRGALGSNQIIVENFNLSDANWTPQGDPGIHLAPTLSLTAGAIAGTASSSAIFPAGSEQSYTLAVDAHRSRRRKPSR